MHYHCSIASTFQNWIEIIFILADCLLCQTNLFAKIILVCICLQILSSADTSLDFISKATLIFTNCSYPCCSYFILIFFFGHLSSLLCNYYSDHHCKMSLDFEQVKLKWIVFEYQILCFDVFC